MRISDPEDSIFERFRTYLALGLVAFTIVAIPTIAVLETRKKHKSGEWGAESSKKGCCGNAKKFKSELNQDVHAAADGDLPRLNPTVVEGAEDIMGAENINKRFKANCGCNGGTIGAAGCAGCAGVNGATRDCGGVVTEQGDCVYAQPYNDRCPQVAGYARSPVGLAQGRLTGTMPTNPLYYDGDYASAHAPKVISWYDSFNDYRPEYEFPAPWSPAYNPVEPYRPADKQIYN